MQAIPDVVLVAISVGVFVGGTVWALAWWLSGQFSEIRAVMYQQIHEVQENILDKLEYHEKHDDSRFDTLGKDIWDIKIRLASKNVRIAEVEKLLNKDK